MTNIDHRFQGSFDSAGAQNVPPGYHPPQGDPSAYGTHPYADQHPQHPQHGQWTARGAQAYARQAAAPPPRRTKKWPWVVGALAVLIVIGSAGDDGSSTTPTSTAAAPPVAAAAPVEPAPVEAAPVEQDYGVQSASYGEGVQAGDLVVTASAPEARTQEFIGTQYCSGVSYRNTGSSPSSFSSFDWNFRTANGVEVTASIPFNSDNGLTTGELRPGGTVSGEICSDTQITDVTEVVYSPGFGIMHQVAFSG